MRVVPFILLLVILTAGASVKPVAADKPDDRERIHAASRAFSEAYVKGDTTTLKNLYTEDAVVLPPGGEVRGRAAIARYFAPRQDRTHFSHEMKSENLQIDGDTAIDFGEWHYEWLIGKNKQSTGDRYLVVWRRCEDGEWRMEYDMWHRPANQIRRP